jgi:hypothetical protein
MPESTAPPPGNDAVLRGRGDEDVVHRAQSEVWLACVRSRARTPKTLAAMGTRFLGDVPDVRRVFARIAHDASDPGRARDSLGGRSVVELVAQVRGYRDTQDVYDSALWAVLGRDPLPIDTLETRTGEITARLLRRRWRAPPAAKAREVIDFVSSLPQPMEPAAFRRWALRLARTPSIDALTLLCLLYERCLREDAIDAARLLHGAILKAARRFCDRPGFASRTVALFVFLIRRRVLSGRRMLDHAYSTVYAAEDLLGAWHCVVDNDEERAWLDHETWRLACALENTWGLKSVMPAPDTILSTIGEGERRFIAEFAQLPMARRLAVRFPGA